MRFIPTLYLISILCSIGILKIDGGEIVGNVVMNAKSRKAMHLVGLIR